MVETKAERGSPVGCTTSTSAGQPDVAVLVQEMNDCSVLSAEFLVAHTALPGPEWQTN